MASSTSEAERSGPSGSWLPSHREYRNRMGRGYAGPPTLRRSGALGENRPLMSEPSGGGPSPTERAMREERKVVTAVFADVVGSTALSERLDPEEAKLILGEAVARIIQAVEEFGGTVKDLAGDGVLALFGAPISHEDDAERAVRAALRITQEIAAYAEEVARAWGVQNFGVRVGVNTGPVVLGPVGAGGRVEYGAFGDTVNTAARLQSAAEPGTVLAGGSTFRVAESLFEWGDPRSLELKGKSQTVQAREVTGARPATARGRGLHGFQAPVVGRDRELAVCREAIGGVLAGSGGILFLSGEAGIGKSRLLAEMRELSDAGAAAERPPAWLEGRCVSYGETLPYWPFRDLVREWLGEGPDQPELRVRVALRRKVERLFRDRVLEVYPYLGAMMGIALEPEAAGRLAELSPEALQYRTFEVVGALLRRLAEDGPVVVAIEDLHWADTTSIQLVERLLPITEEAAVLLAFTLRLERDHPSWEVKERAARQLPHRTRELLLESLADEADRELLHALVGGGTLPPELETQILAHAEGNPFYMEELIGSVIDAGALVREGEEWRFDHEVSVEVPETVEKVILARIDRLTPRCHDVLMAASVLGRRFGLPLLDGVTGRKEELRDALSELQRLDLVREGRRWPQPEYRFKHALIQEAAYRTILTEQRTRLHRKAAEWLEDRHSGNEEEVYGLLAHHWLAANDEHKAISYLTRAGDKARLEYALDEAIVHYRALLPLLERRGERQAIALVLFKLALALHCSMRFAEANATYGRAFEFWTPPDPWARAPAATLRVATSFLPNDPDPKSAIAWPNIQLCMQLFDRLVEQWPERTIVPSLAERWEISNEGLRYVFHLREGLRWSDGHVLTAHDVEFGIKRVLNPDSPGSSVAIYFVLENGQNFYLGRNRDADRIGVRALDDRRVEFRLVAPAPYFMSVMNRPDSGPQPRHAIEHDGPAWTDPDRQVVSGPFRQEERTDDLLVLLRQDGYTGVRTGNVRRVEMLRSKVADASRAYETGQLDVISVRYTPRLADLVSAPPEGAILGPAAWTLYLAFDHRHPITSNVEVRRSLAHAIDREAMAPVAPMNLIVATGGIVPPALEGHTPDIVPRFDPKAARAHLAASGVGQGQPEVAVAALEDFEPMVSSIARSWEAVLGLRVSLRWWTWREATQHSAISEVAPIVVAGWLPGYPDPEYYLRLLLHSDSKTNEGGFAYPQFDELIEQARQERSDRERLELFHEADRLAVADRIALIPLAYGRSMAFVKPWVKGWWEFGKTSSSFADLLVEDSSPRVGRP
jgi:ABC-type oligopeptide transport system substrate-binding subunit/class 3 adenylate cyclase